MPPQLALLLTVAFILWLLAKDLKRRRNVSHALWIPLLWLVIISSRPVTMWFGVQVSSANTQLDGTPLDRFAYLLLIIAGFLVLKRRRVDWSNVIVNNKWLFIFFLYLGFSVLWSEYPFIAFKRWIKDAGNIVMILLVFSEADPVNAVKALFLRCAFILIPLSVLFIRYFPNIGRYFDPWVWTYEYCGVSTDKNDLGSTLIIYGVTLLWAILDWRKDKSKAKERSEIVSYGFLFALCLWLLFVARSATSQTCTMLGGCILLGMSLPGIRNKVKHLELYAAGLALFLTILNFMFNLGEAVTGALGRNMTLTDRTLIWQRLLQIDINPLIGTGYYSFWLDNNRVEQVSQGFYYKLNESHSGYIETYLNSGFIGLFLLIALFVSAVRSIKRQMLMEGGSYAAMRLAFLMIAMAYNVTEAAFDRLGIIWFACLLAVSIYPHFQNFDVNGTDEEIQDRDEKSEFESALRYPVTGCFRV